MEKTCHNGRNILEEIWNQIGSARKSLTKMLKTREKIVGKTRMLFYRNSISLSKPLIKWKDEWNYQTIFFRTLKRRRTQTAKKGWKVTNHTGFWSRKCQELQRDAKRNFRRKNQAQQNTQDERKDKHEGHVKKLFESAEGRGKVLHQTTTQTAWRGGMQLTGDVEQYVRFEGRIQHKFAEWKEHWHVGEEAQCGKKPWTDMQLGSEEAMLAVKELDLKRCRSVKLLFLNKWKRLASGRQGTAQRFF